MELRSRLDFEEEEKERQKRHEQFNNQLTEAKTKRIEQNLPDDVYQSILVEIALNYEHDGFTEVDEILGKEALRKRQEREAESIIERRRRLEAIHGGFFRDASLAELEEEEALRQAELGVSPEDTPVRSEITVPTVPPGVTQVTTVAEALALPKGTLFMTPDGRMKIR